MRNRIITISIIGVLLVGVLMVYSYPKNTLAKCPDAYGVDDAGSAQYLAATNKWTNDFFDAHPDATMSDWAQARHQFWIDNNCTAALDRYEEAKASQ